MFPAGKIAADTYILTLVRIIAACIKIQPNTHNRIGNMPYNANQNWLRGGSVNIHAYFLGHFYKYNCSGKVIYCIANSVKVVFSQA